MIFDVTTPLVTDDPADIMLDLETMGVSRFSPVTAIGAVRFQGNTGDVHVADTFYQAITLESCMELGLRPDASTIVWWLTDPGVTDAARAHFVDPEAVALPLALDAFTDWLNSRPDTLWGNSASFDCGLLADAYKVCGKQVPWQFYRGGCYRTIKNLPKARDIQLVRCGTHHNALDDAISQADHLRQIRVHLGL